MSHLRQNRESLGWTDATSPISRICAHDAAIRQGVACRENARGLLPIGLRVMVRDGDLGR